MQNWRQQVGRSDYFPLFRPYFCETMSGVLWPILGSAVCERYWLNWSKSSRATKIISVHTTKKERLRTGLCPWEEKAQGRPCCFLKTPNQRVYWSLISEAYSNRTRGSRHKLEHSKFSLDESGENQLQDDKYWNSLPRVAVLILGVVLNSAGEDAEQPSLTRSALSGKLNYLILIFLVSWGIFKTKNLR